MALFKLINNKFGKKGEISVQTFFFILMSLLMVWIIYFGVSKLMLVDNLVSEQDKTQLKEKLKSSYDFCSEPLNKGSFTTFKSNSKLFNGICVIGEDILDSSSNFGSFEELKILYETGDNLALINAHLISNQLDSLDIIDKVKLDSSFLETKCYFNEGEGNNFEVKIEC